MACSDQFCTVLSLEQLLSLLATFSKWTRFFFFCQKKKKKHFCDDTRALLWNQPVLVSSGNASWDAQCWAAQAPPVGVWPSCHSYSVGFCQVWLIYLFSFWLFGFYIRVVASCVLASLGISCTLLTLCWDTKVHDSSKKEWGEGGGEFFVIIFTCFLRHLHCNNKNNRILAFSN